MGIGKVEPQNFPHHCEGTTSRSDDKNEAIDLLLRDQVVIKKVTIGYPNHKRLYLYLNKRLIYWAAPSFVQLLVKYGVAKATPATARGNERNRDAYYVTPAPVWAGKFPCVRCISKPWGDQMRFEGILCEEASLKYMAELNLANTPTAFRAGREYWKSNKQHYQNLTQKTTQEFNVQCEPRSVFSPSFTLPLKWTYMCCSHTLQSSPSWRLSGTKRHSSTFYCAFRWLNTYLSLDALLNSFSYRRYLYFASCSHASCPTTSATPASWTPCSVPSSSRISRR